MVTNQTIEIEGTKTVSVKTTTGHEKPIFTVIMSFTVVEEKSIHWSYGRRKQCQKSGFLMEFFFTYMKNP
jgi:hypothetical protein